MCKHVASEALDAMCRYPWPGNIRELAHVVETAVLMTDLDRLTVSDLPSQVLQPRPTLMRHFLRPRHSAIPR